MAVKIAHWPAAIIIASFFILGSIAIVNDMNTNYGLSLDTSDFDNTYDLVNETYDLSQNFRNASLGTDVTEATTIESVTKGAFSAVRLIGNSFGIVIAVLSDIQKVLGIPTWIIVFAIAALTFAISFAVVAFFRGFNT